MAQREEEAQSALKLLVQIAEVEPLFLQNSISTLVDTMLSIANARQFEEGMIYCIANLIHQVVIQRC